MADTRDGDGSARSRRPAPHASALDATPTNSSAPVRVHSMTDGASAQAPLESVASSRTKTFETSNDELARQLREQFTPRLITQLRRYAEYRGRMVRAAGRVCPPLARYARELVHDAYADTWSGERAWDPARCSLAEHLRGVIDSRTWNELKAARPHASLDEPFAKNNEDRVDDEQLTLPDMLSASSGEIRSLALPALIGRTCNQLRQATQDHDCIAIVRAWELGFLERNEIMELTGLDAVAYRRALSRLLYISDDLPDKLRQLVRDHLRSAG